jgi:hypothetical protein
MLRQLFILNVRQNPIRWFHFGSDSRSADYCASPSRDAPAGFPESVETSVWDLKWVTPVTDRIGVRRHCAGHESRRSDSGCCRSPLGHRHPESRQAYVWADCLIGETRRLHSKPRSMSGVAIFLLLFHLLWFANRAALEAMDQSLPPRPALFLRLMLILKPSRFRQLFSNLWVTYPHTRTPFRP